MYVRVTNTVPSKAEMERALGNAIEKGVEDGSEAILGQAVRDAPIDTSRLRQSGKYQTFGTGARQLSVIGFYTPYARRQHDEPFNHPKGGKQFYLSDAASSNTAKLLLLIAGRIKMLGMVK